jgi:DNA-directed RNA polymerase subunit beta'
VPYGATLSVEQGQEIISGDLLFSWDPYSEPLVADSAGVIKFIDIVDEQTMREELDESTGRRQMTIIEDREKKLHPMIQIVSTGKKQDKLREFIVPVGAQLTVRDGEAVNPGDTIAKISREVYKTRDITGGLPRVAELFEARRPKDPAVITEIDGKVSFGDIKRGKREVVVSPETGPARAYEVPVGKHMRVHEGDQVRAGDRLSEGPINPHDILRIKGRARCRSTS